RRLRKVVEGRLPEVLGLDGVLLRSRRNDPEREDELRNRPPRRRFVWNPGAALPRGLQRFGDPAGETHAGDLPRNHSRDERYAALTDADAEGAVRAAPGRPDHSRGRDDAHGSE